MGYDGTGKIYIPLEDFYAFVKKYIPQGVERSGFIRLGESPGSNPKGVPQGITMTESDLEMGYAYSTECDPAEWAVPPDFLKKTS